MGPMKTTLELPDALVLEIKRHALDEGVKLKDAMAGLLRLGLRASRRQTSTSTHRVSLPLVACRQTAELTPDQVSDALLQQEAESHS